MATQTEYVITASTAESMAVGAGTTSRQWMTPDGVYLDEQISGGGAGGTKSFVIVSS